jgi:hypothetical protein
MRILYLFTRHEKDEHKTKAASCKGNFNVSQNSVSILYSTHVILLSVSIYLCVRTISRFIYYLLVSFT